MTKHSPTATLGPFTGIVKGISMYPDDPRGKDVDKIEDILIPVQSARMFVGCSDQTLRSHSKGQVEPIVPHVLTSEGILLFRLGDLHEIKRILTAPRKRKTRVEVLENEVAELKEILRNLQDPDRLMTAAI